MVWRVIEHNGCSVVSVREFKTETEALEYKADYDITHSHPCWLSISYCNRDTVAYYSNS